MITMSWWEIIVVWYAAISIVSLVSYIFKPLPTFDFIEGVTMGVGAATTVLAQAPTLYNFFLVTSAGRYLVIVPIILGIMYNFIVTRWRWAAYYPSAFIVGIGLGKAITLGIDSQIFDQIRSNIVGSFTGAITTGSSYAWLDAVIISVGTLTSLAYFLYAREQKGTWGIVARIGRLFMMASLGISFGSYIADRADGNAALFDVVLNVTRKSLGLV